MIFRKELDERPNSVYCTPTEGKELLKHTWMEFDVKKYLLLHISGYNFNVGFQLCPVHVCSYCTPVDAHPKNSRFPVCRSCPGSCREEDRFVVHEGGE